MSIKDWPRRAYNWLTGSGGNLNEVLPTTLPDNELDRYDILDAWYDNVQLYQKLFAVGLGPGKGVRPIGGPFHEGVEFHASHLWPETLEDLPIEADDEKIEEAARTVLEWSNWGEVKQTLARWFPAHGHSFLKAERIEDSARHYVRLMEPRHVTDYKKDPRGFIVMMRLDIPIEENGVKKTHTELWEKKNKETGQGRFRSWKHDRGPGVKLEELEELTTEVDEPLTAFGSDFVPFVHKPFQSNGKERGDSAFAHALEAFGELDRIVTRAHDMTFVEDPVVLKRNEAGGAAVTLEQLASVEGDEESKEVEVSEGRKMIMLPGLASAEILAAPIDAAATTLIEGAWTSAIRQAPELLYYVMQQKGDPSGIALSLKMAPAQDRGLEARYNGESAIIQCIKMCLTFNQSASTSDPQLAEFKNLGSFDSGDFDGLKFTERQLLPESDGEKAVRVKAELENIEQAIRAFQALGLDTSELKKKAAEIMEVDIESVGDAVPADVDAQSGDGNAPARVSALMGQFGLSTNGGEGA